MVQQQVVVQNPFTLTQATTNLTHSAGSGTASQTDLIAKYQIPAGLSIVFGGAKDKQKFAYHDLNISGSGGMTPATGRIDIYKVSPDGDTQKIRLASYESERLNSDSADQTKLVDIGKEPARAIKEFEWIYIYFTPRTALTYSATASTFYYEMTQLTALSPV